MITHWSKFADVDRNSSPDYNCGLFTKTGFILVVSFGITTLIGIICSITLIIYKLCSAKTESRPLLHMQSEIIRESQSKQGENSMDMCTSIYEEIKPVPLAIDIIKNNAYGHFLSKSQTAM